MRPIGTWIRVTRTSPCPICGRRTWCGVTADGGTVRCMRATEGGRPHPQGGRTFRVKDVPTHVRRPTLIAPRPWPDLDSVVTAGVAGTDDTALAALAAELSLPDGTGLAALRRLRAWIPRPGVAAFPMIGPGGHACGIRYRSRSGGKWSERGGREGLFRPVPTAANQPLLLPEGATDTTALMSLGFAAAGRPSCSGGEDLVLRLVRHVRPPTVVVVADQDQPGQLGATALAHRMSLLVRDTRIVTPPEPFKDVRAWVANGGTRANIETAIANAERVTVAWVKVNQW